MAMNLQATYEFYNAETGAGFGLNPFWGWSALAYIMPLECILNYNPTDLKQEKIIAIGRDLLELSLV